MILMDQMIKSTLVITWVETPWAPMFGQPSLRIGTVGKCTYGSCRPGGGSNGQPGRVAGSGAVRVQLKSPRQWVIYHPLSHHVMEPQRPLQARLPTNNLSDAGL
jgi:hypothetical protein